MGEVSKKWNTKAILVFLVIVSIAVLCGWKCTTISRESLDNINDMIKDVASVIFAVSGLWVALFCPEALQILTKKTGNLKDKLEKLTGLSEIFFPIYISVSVIAFCVLHILASNLLASLQLGHETAIILKQVSFGFLVLVSCSLFFALIITCLPGIRLVLEIKKDMDAQRKVENKYPKSKTAVKKDGEPPA